MRKLIQLALVFIFSLPVLGIAQNDLNSIVTTDAGKAFVARDYETALAEFNLLANRNPHDLTIKRYQAICLDRLGRSKEAAEVLKQILLLSTQAVSVHYHLATIYYKLQESELAEQHFNEVVSIASGSKYDELAQVYLDAIANQRFNLLKPGAPKRWSIYATLGISDDIGSRQAFNGEDRAGTRTSAYATANYYFIRNHQWTGTVGFSLFGSQHSHDSLSDNDFKQWGIRTAIQKQTQIKGKPTVFRFSLDYKDLKFGDRDYSDGLSGSINTRMRLTENTATNFYFLYGQDKFDPLLSFDPEFVVTRQDLIYAGLDHSVYLKDRSIELGGGVFTNHINADSDNFTREGYGVRAFGRFTLPYKFQLRLSATYRDDDYPDHIGPIDRGFESIYYGAGLSRQLTKNISANLIYRKYDIDYSSNFGSADYDSIGLYFSYVY